MAKYPDKYRPKVQDWNKYRSIKTQLDIQAVERDGHKCVQCEYTKGLEVHHKIRGIEELDNLITLCHSCHKKEHGMAGCFKKGFDRRRTTLMAFNKDRFYNRHIGEWVFKN